MAGQFDGCLRLRLEEKTMRVMRVSFWRGAYYWQLRNMKLLTMVAPFAKVNYSGLCKVIVVGRYSLSGSQCHPETPE